MSIDNHRHPPGRARTPAGALAILLPLVTVLSTALGGCGFGTSDDSGTPEPGQWWPLVCPDGGTIDPAMGCVVALLCPESPSGACADGGN